MPGKRQGIKAEVRLSALQIVETIFDFNLACHDKPSLSGYSFMPIDISFK